MLRSQKHGREPGALVSQAESWDDPQDSSDLTPVSPTRCLTNVSPSSPAILHAPPIPGLFFTPSLLVPDELAEEVTQFCMGRYFNRPSFRGTYTPSSSRPRRRAARQAILNLYRPGEGITPHVDLLRRFGDGIVGVSFGSGCLMQFARVAEAEGVRPLNLFLPERSVLVLSGDARYGWTHGIEERTADLVAGTGVVERGVRLSITFRWLLPGADVVGEQDGEKIALNI
ncbi:hypothetical protein DFH09DRAFT_1222044 [Mycena vulgaris]|nr:hypothetical protein DFH09DRAFT_1222044 [Mycena vulgaris]